MSDLFYLNAKSMLPSQMIEILSAENTDLDEYLGTEIYANNNKEYIAIQKERMIQTLALHQNSVGDIPVYLLRAPGRLNAFLEYLDMCAGDHMSTTIDGDIPVAVSIRDDGKVVCRNDNLLFAEGRFDIETEFNLFKNSPWDESKLPDTWDNRTRLHPYYGHKAGEWLNYVRCSFLRTKWEFPDLKLLGANMTFGPASAPFRAGTSSSSAIVVLSFLAMYLANHDLLPKWSMSDVCRLLGEAEWYVGTHGGANDQTTILRNCPNGVLYNRHSAPILDSDILPCIEGVKVVLVDSLWEANKALGANHIFNLRKGWMDLADDLMKHILNTVKGYINSVGVEAENKPGWLPDLINSAMCISPCKYPAILESKIDVWKPIFKNYNKLGSLSEDILGVSSEVIEELICLLPEEISADDAGKLLGKTNSDMERDYTLPYESEGGYRVRNAAIFFFKENRIGRRLEHLFIEADKRLSSSEIAIDSDEYDFYRLEVGQILDELQKTIRDDFQVSNNQLDLLLNISKSGPGYLGGKLTGAGSGGCVSIMIRDGYEDAFCEYIDENYYRQVNNFDEYRKTLDDLAKDNAENSSEWMMAKEMKQNLESALSGYRNYRRAVTFSRGACAIELENFA